MMRHDDGENLEWTRPTRTRLPYGAVPLMPWEAKYPVDGPKSDNIVENEPYLTASLRHIEAELVGGIAGALERGVLEDDYRLSSIFDFAAGSLFDAQTRRVNFNNTHHLPSRVFPTQEVMQAALDGEATPEELLTILLETEELQSIELAKLSHPFDYNATKDMDIAVHDALIKNSFTPIESPETKYKKKRVNTTLAAMTMVQKRAIAMLNTGENILEVVQRSSLLVIDNEESNLVASHYIVNGNESEEAFQDVAVMVDFRLRSNDLSKCKWLFPLTTSYYVRRIKPIVE